MSIASTARHVLPLDQVYESDGFGRVSLQTMVTSLG
jgi:hypothetical protein